MEYPKDKHSRAWGLWMRNRKSVRYRKAPRVPPGNKHQQEQRQREKHAQLDATSDAVLRPGEVTRGKASVPTVPATRKVLPTE